MGFIRVPVEVLCTTSLLEDVALCDAEGSAVEGRRVIIMVEDDLVEGLIVVHPPLTSLVVQGEFDRYISTVLCLDVVNSFRLLPSTVKAITGITLERLNEIRGQIENILGNTWKHNPSVTEEDNA